MPVVRRSSSVLGELGWLAYFLAVFAVVAVLMIAFVVPHHFNDRVAIMISAIFAGLAMIVTRAWWTQRTRGTIR